jgi:hypothetical protein
VEVARQPKCVNDVEAFGVLDRCSPHKSRPIARMGLLGHWRGGARPASAWGRARGGVRQQWLRAVVHGGVLWRFWDAVPLGTPPSMMHCWYEPNEPVLWCYAVHGCTAVATVGRSGGRRSCGGDVSQGTASVRCGWPCVRGRQIRCHARRWCVVRGGPGDG